ncbi:hypothetical protein E2C01_028608 [Portunus trituberculatus]|uniref:Uncharacterized protein n=1 Tax=Portunus trituberculatus TaxID=210409 RepID=A0A5B7EKW8_PORTR|nr:hypothetical protein [Portunus trituberculatus]
MLRLLCIHGRHGALLPLAACQCSQAAEPERRSFVRLRPLPGSPHGSDGTARGAPHTRWRTGALQQYLTTHYEEPQPLSGVTAPRVRAARCPRCVLHRCPEETHDRQQGACRCVGQRGGTTGGLLRASSNRTLAELCPGTRAATPPLPPALALCQGPPGPLTAPPPEALPHSLALSPRAHSSRLRPQPQHQFSCCSPLFRQYRLWHCPALPRLAPHRPAPAF